MRNYFISYNPSDKINYIYLFMLYGIAEYDKTKRRYERITFSSKKELAATIKSIYGDCAFSYATLNRILNNPIYRKYFTIDTNSLILNNNYTNSTKAELSPFIVVNSEVANFLIRQGDKLLASYYCYLKYYCGLASKAGSKQDSTAKQFLLSVGLSADNHNTLTKISSYHTLRTKEGLLTIKKYRDQNGHERNVYSIP